MAIPKHKLAILIAGLKPKGAEPDASDEGGDTEDVGETESHDLDTVVKDLAHEIVGGDEAKIAECLHSLVDCITEEDEAEDAGEKKTGY